MYNNPLWYARCITLVLGIMFLGLGITFTIQAGLGVNPWTVFHIGISQWTAWSVGRVTQLVGLVLLVLGALMLRQIPGIGTIVNMILVGWFVDLFMTLSWPVLNTIFSQILYVLIGITLIGLGTGMYISTNFGEGPRDAIMMGLARIWRKPVGKIRSGMELTVLCLGFLMGGPIGVGTVMGILIGPIVQYSLALMRRIWESHGYVYQVG